MSPAARPSLLPVAAFVSLLVLVLAATGLFALHHTNGQTRADLGELYTVDQRLILTLRTRAAFKTQVQEWKNLLLRGHDETERARYLASFHKEEADTRRGLEKLAETAPRDDHGTGDTAAQIALILEEHSRLSAVYRAALETQDLAASPRAAFAIDAAVRGADRELSDKLDRLAGAIDHLAGFHLKQISGRAIARYDALRRITWIVASLAVLASLWLCFRAARLR